jgi:O-antigen/teichoic acid export membrane protein
MFVLLASSMLVRALFSQKFVAAIGLFPWQMAGDYCRFITFAIAAPIVPQERFLARNLLAVAQYGVYLTAFYILLPRFGLHGVVAANFANWSFALTSIYLYLRRVNGFRFDRGNLRLLVTSAAALFAIIMTLRMHGVWWRLAGWGILGLWVATAPTRDDRAKLMDTLRARLARPAEAPAADDVAEAGPGLPPGGDGSGQ